MTNTIATRIAQLRQELATTERHLADARAYNARAGSYLDESRFAVAGLEGRAAALRKQLDKWEELRRATAAAGERVQAREERVRAAAGRPPCAGDEYLVPPLPESVCLSWLVCSAHPDHADLFFCAPVDDVDAWIGISDVRAEGHRVARCGFCLWLPAAMLEEGLRVDVDRTDAAHVVRAHVAAMLRGAFTTTPEQDATEDDPEYLDLRLVIGTASHEVERRRQEIPEGE